MRILSVFFKWLSPCVAAVGLPFLCSGAGQPDNVVLQYHFLGAAQLAGNTNIGIAKKAFSFPSTTNFENLVLSRLATNLAASLHWQTNAETVALLRPLLDDVLRDESMASVGGSIGKPVNYVLAIHLDTNRAQVWQKNLQAASHGPGEKLSAETFSGWQWNKGANDSFWMVPARDWLLVGRGGDLASVRSDYLQQIQKSGRPGPALDINLFEADVDWPRLTNWFPLPLCPLKLGRTIIDITTEKGVFRMTSKMTYGEPIQWQSQPWRIPTNMVRQPLVSFATGQDVAPFLKSDETLSRFCTDPLTNQFYFWSMGEMPFESYVAWPAANPSNMMKELSSQALAALNPKLKAINGSELRWNPEQSQIVWTKVPLTVPSLQPATAANGQFLVAGLFSVTDGTGPAPKELWEQVKGRTDLVYYDWEQTGVRLLEIRTLTQVLPILKVLGVGPKEPFVEERSAGLPSAPAAPFEAQARLNIEEQWLSRLTRMPGYTVTEVTKTGPNELTVIRNSPLVFTSLELVLLSHWLSDTPAGPVNQSLLPQPKRSGPGAPPPQKAGPGGVQPPQKSGSGAPPPH